MVTIFIDRRIHLDMEIVESNQHEDWGVFEGR